MRWCSLFSRRHGTGRERGAVAILTALTLFFVIPGFAALSVDIGRYMFERQQLQNALDAGALAGAQLLPFNGQGAAETAREFARKNDPDLPEEVEINVSFGCLVHASADNPQRAARTEVISVCRQFQDATDTFVCQDNGRCYLPCVFENENDSCNAITVRAAINVPLILARLIPGNMVTNLGANLESNACRGFCGTPPHLRLVMLLDRSSTLGADEYENVQEGAISVLESDFDPELHEIALGAIPNCSPAEFDLEGCRTDIAPFIKEPFTNDFERLGEVIKTLTSGGGETNLGTPIEEARALFENEAIDNPDLEINNYIILLTDGLPNRPLPQDALEARCEHAFNQAEAAKQDGVRVFTIGYSLEEGDGTCPDPGFEGVTAADLLQSMASGGENSGPPLVSECDQENQDEDDFFCETENQELTEVFNQIIAEIFNDLGGSSLVDLSVYQLESEN
ncbi:MAG: hypothetical protein ETSY1_00420 [Candidatus Entotheonella factor]|uniref:VWFA domain-containing protein n=1 Tax=Entotheonella factor TaxID=1429438 RepID=W4LZ13_ENTF1|nr:MAG: hypothetical protein ETSY1_00420 [Candidatus Entotheonella factor]